MKQPLRSDSLGESVWWNYRSMIPKFRKGQYLYDSFPAISMIWLYADNHPVHKEPSWWSFDNYLLISKLQTVEAHLNCTSLLSSANYVPGISTHNNIHSFAHSFWAIQLYNLQVMSHQITMSRPQLAKISTIISLNGRPSSSGFHIVWDYNQPLMDIRPKSEVH
jgi:hypothetical protein